jgi:[acyl-carrier-protein] S-malonyltransferase
LISQLLKDNGIIPDTVCGLSLGEYNALECANVISFEDGLKILKVRASLMKNAFEAGATKMAAVLKADHQLVNDVLNNPILNNMVSICNYNTFDQVVIGGTIKELGLAIVLLHDAGFKKIIPLDVSCVSHMHLLKDTAQELEKHLARFDYSKPDFKFINNVDGAYQEANFVSSLAKQIAYPTKLVFSIEKMLNDGIDTFIDIGPKKTTASFIKSIAKKKDVVVKIFSIYDVATFKNTLESLGERDD